MRVGNSDWDTASVGQKLIIVLIGLVALIVIGVVIYYVAMMIGFGARGAAHVTKGAFNATKGALTRVDSYSTIIAIDEDIARLFEDVDKLNVGRASQSSSLVDYMERRSPDYTQFFSKLRTSALESRAQCDENILRDNACLQRYANNQSMFNAELTRLIALLNQRYESNDDPDFKTLTDYYRTSGRQLVATISQYNELVKYHNVVVKSFPWSLVRWFTNTVQVDHDKPNPFTEFKYLNENVSESILR